MTSPETSPVPPPSAPALALLLDVDGPVASPVTRDVKPGIIADLLALAAAGIPVIFNTGRSDAFIREQVMEPMIAAGMPAGRRHPRHLRKRRRLVQLYRGRSRTCARGPRTRHARAFGDDVRRLVAEDYSAHMFFDETKRAMVSVEQHIAVASADYLAEQELFDADAMDLMARHGLGVVRLDHHAPNSDDQIDYRVDPTIISTDIESVRLGKDLGASRAVEFLAAQGITPQAWRTVGDSRTDYAMADWLHHNDHAVKHVDVRPADGIPVKPYEVLTAADLGLGEDVIHDDAGAAFLHHWLAVVTG